MSYADSVHLRHDEIRNFDVTLARAFLRALSFFSGWGATSRAEGVCKLKSLQKKGMR
jgi:hypothetical protein